jgi:hypothetical protein
MSGGEKFLGKAEECEHGAAHLTDLGASGMGCAVCADMELDALDSRVQAGLDVPRVAPVHTCCEVCEERDGDLCPTCRTTLCPSCAATPEHAGLHGVAS